MSTGPTLAQIRGQVGAIRRERPSTRAIAIRTSTPWTGEKEYTENEQRYAVYACSSPLAMRVALQEPVDDAIKVLLTDSADELSGDLRVRLSPDKVLRLDPWQIVRSLFSAQQIDPRLFRHVWIADMLMEAAPAGGFAPVAGGFLDADHAWHELLKAQLGLQAERPDLIDLLSWSLGSQADLLSLPEEFRQEVAVWFEDRNGEVAGVVFRCITQHGPQLAVPIGLTAGVLFDARDRDRRQKEIGKFEQRFFGGKTVAPEVITRWQAAATDALSREFDDQLRATVLAEVDKLLVELGAEEWAYLSDASPRGFDQRMRRFGDVLNNISASAQISSAQELEQHRQEIFAHRKQKSETRRLERVQMAERLVQFLASDEVDPPASLAEATEQYFSEGGYVDWARWMLQAGDPVKELGEAYSALFARVTQVCEERAQQFAQLLASWIESGGSAQAFVPVEQVLERVVAPLAEHNPLLVIVLDGMSVAVFRELVQSIVGNEWWLMGQEGNRSLLGLAAVPSVTALSRTSLLTGALQMGDSSVEKREFSKHPDLLATCKKDFAPLLYHKADLTGDEDSGLANEIRHEIANPEQRQIVGVVVNAIDDHLSKGDQLDTAWNSDTIRVLPLLLHAARTAGRTVVLLSDHGHVLEAEGQKLEGDGSERWRASTGQCAEGEMRIEGARVQGNGGDGGEKALIAPWSEKIRYVMKKNGYHGGLTPQEMVVPIGVLGLPGDTIPGWEALPPGEPRWWDRPSWVDPEGGAESPKPKPPPGMLFDKKPAATDSDAVQAEPTWVVALLACPLFAAQKKLAGRKVPPDDVFRKVFVAIDRQGGKVTAVALARTIQYPQMRLPGLLSVMQRVLNFDGFQVLAREDASDTIALDTGLLCKQFELES